jgi:hypothetical protein
MSREANKLAKRKSRLNPDIRKNEAVYYENFGRKSAKERAKKRRRNPEQWPSSVIGNIKYRAKKQGLDFTITKKDLVVPEFCPVLGIKLEVGYGKNYNRGCSPSVDRFDNNIGYTPENIRVISYRANRLKCDATVEELHHVIKYMTEGK